MKIATYNVNGINSRLPVLLRWLRETAPDVICLQELKAPQDKFPEQPLLEAGYTALWKGQKSYNGVAVLSRGIEMQAVYHSLPGDEEDIQRRYLEVQIRDFRVGCLYLPNGNPAPGPKFDYKLRWLEHFQAYAASLVNAKIPIILAGDYNIIPTVADAYKPERWLEDALFRPESRAAFQTLLGQGWTDALRQLYPQERLYNTGIIFGMRTGAMRDCGSIISY